MDGKDLVCPSHPNLSSCVYSTEEALREYIRLYVRIPLVSRIGVLAQTLDFVADAAPGVKEILAIGKVCYEVRAGHHDLVVVDAESSGHIPSQLATPHTIRSLTQVGMLREQTDWMIEMLSDVDTTAVILVTTPEESPVDETIELVGRIRAESHVDVPLVVVNRMPPSPPRDTASAAPHITATLAARHGVATAQVGRLADLASAEVVLVPRSAPTDSVEVVNAVAGFLDDEFGESL